LFEVVAVLPEGPDIVEVEDEVAQLGVELVLAEALQDLREVGEEGVLLEFKVDISFGEPGLGKRLHGGSGLRFGT
jgi:hypothetical protein